MLPLRPATKSFDFPLSALLHFRFVSELCFIVMTTARLSITKERGSFGNVIAFRLGYILSASVTLVFSRDEFKDKQKLHVSAAAEILNALQR
jgi:hypothetical protein